MVINCVNHLIAQSGCDSGFGHEAAVLLNSKGFRVYATCMFPEDVGSKNLIHKASSPQSMIILHLDVTSDKSIDSLYDYVMKDLEDNNCKLWCLINNAGVARIGMAEWGDFDYHFRQIMEVNTFGVVKMCRKFLPLLRQSRGRIVIIGSITSKIFLPFTTAYSMSKKALLAFADGLRWECNKFGIQVTTIEPNFASTNLMSLDNSLNLADKVYRETSDSVKSVYEEKTQELIQFYHLPHSKFKNMNFVLKQTPLIVVQTVLDRYPPNSRSVNTFLQQIVYSFMQIAHLEWIEFMMFLLSKLIVTNKCRLCKQFAKVFQKPDKSLKAA